MEIRVADTPENEAKIRGLLSGCFEFEVSDGQFPIAEISRSDGWVTATANEGEYPPREIICLYRDLAFSDLPAESWTPKYPEYMGQWDARGEVVW